MGRATILKPTWEQTILFRKIQKNKKKYKHQPGNKTKNKNKKAFDKQRRKPMREQPCADPASVRARHLLGEAERPTEPCLSRAKKCMRGHWHTSQPSAQPTTDSHMRGSQLPPMRLCPHPCEPVILILR